MGTWLGALGVGTFDVIGSMNDFDRDYFSWTLAGSSPASVSLIKWDTTAVASTFSVRVSDSVLTTSFNSEFGLGNASNLFADLFDLAGVSKSGNGFSAGTRTGTGTVDYGFRIVTVSAVPVPASLPLLLGALGAMGLTARQRRRKIGSRV